MPLRIAQFVHRYPPALGGAESYIARLTEHVYRLKHHVSVYTTTARTLPEMTRLPGAPSSSSETPHTLVRIYRFQPWVFPLRRPLWKGLSMLPWRPWQLAFMPSSPTCPTLWRTVSRARQPVDVVHAVALPYGFPLVCAWRLALRCRARFVLTPFLHWGDEANPNDPTRRQYTGPALRWLMQQADCVLAQTEAEARVLRTCGVKPERIRVQGLGVESAECTSGNRDRFRQRWHIAAHAVVIGHLANLSVEKGSVALADAFLQLAKHHPEAVLVLAGEAMPNFLARAAEVQQHPRIHVIGRLNDEDRRDFYAGIDLFAFPSTTDSFGLVLLEAWANGLPVVVARAGGPAALVQHEADGLQVPVGDTTALVHALQRLICNPEERIHLGQAGHTRSIRDFTWERSLTIATQALVG
jgi:glycosyltransferase involved in cell wall biosynthesis